MKKNIIALSLVLLTFISCEQDISTSPLESEPTKAFVFITSYPSGAMIYKNGKYSGRRTPDTLKFVDFGEYSIKLKMENFRDTIFNLKVSEEKLDKIDINYTTNPLMLGQIFCVSNPSKAKIYLNDSLTNKISSDTLKGLLPGKYSIRFSYPEHRDGETSVIVRSNQVSRAAQTLQDTTLWVDYNDGNSEIKYDYINCIKIDKNNIKWLGTEGFGIIKYDEKEFLNYRPPTFPIPSGLVTAIDVDENNVKWIATYGGVARFDDVNWIAFRQWNSPLLNDYVNDIKCEKNTGNIWIATSSGVNKFDGFAGWTNYVYDSVNVTYPYGPINCVEIDEYNNKWFGSPYMGIYLLQDTTWTNMYYSPEYNFLSNSIVCSAIAPNGYIWLGHEKSYYSEEKTLPRGFSYYNGSNWVLYPNLLNYNILYDIYVDERGYKWVCTDNGLFRFKDANNIQVFNTSNSGIKSNNIQDVVRDKDGIVWIATAGGGLVKYKGDRGR